MNSWTVVTGANRGIGLALVNQLKSSGNRVLAVCRKSSKELNQIGIDVIEGVDVTNPSSFKPLLNFLKNSTVECLINNAGVLFRDGLESLSVEEIRLQFEVNALGPLFLTQALLTHFTHGSKVVIISSRMGSIADNTSGGMYGYRMSKSAANMVGQSLSVDLKTIGVAVAVLHPGYVRTEMTGGRGYIDPEESATGLIERVDSLTLQNSGGFWHANGEILPW